MGIMALFWGFLYEFFVSDQGLDLLEYGSGRIMLNLMSFADECVVYVSRETYNAL